MATNGSGYYANGGNGHGQFRRATGKVAMAGVDTEHHQQQQPNYYQQPAQQHHPSTAPYPHSAMAAPPPPPQQTSYYGHPAAGAMHPQQQHQQWSDPVGSQSYYQQTLNGPAHAGYAASGSDEVLGVYAEHKRTQQLRPDSGQRAMADSAVHSSAYVSQQSHAADAMTGQFQQLGIGARQAPLAPRQHMTAEAMRQREQALENAYDEDDGFTGADIDVSLFPSNASQVVGTMRTGPVAMPTSPTRPTERPSRPTPTKPPSQPVAVARDRSSSVRIKKCTSLYAPATGAHVAAGTALPLESPRLPARQAHKMPWTGVSRSNTSTPGHGDSANKPRHIQRRQPSDTSAPSRRHSTRAHCNDPAQTRPHVHVPPGARPPTSRNVSGNSGQLPADIAAAQRFHGSANGSGFSTGTNSPAPGARPYAHGNGFDSSSDYLQMNGRIVQQPHHYQQPNAGQTAAVSPFAEPSAPPLAYAEQPSMQGPTGHQIYGAAADSNYSHSSNGDGVTLHDPGLAPPASMRPWTASSRSLPLAAPSPHFAERERPSSSASSATGMPPMGVHPSANAAPASPPKAPTPTVASLDAYRTSIKRSNDPAAQLDFAKYVLEHARGIADNEPNPKLARKRYEMLTDEGLKWVRKLAGAGITVHRSNIAAEAQYFLGTVYSRGIYNVPRDDAKAFSYYQQASKAQHAEANYRTAVCYEIGVGTRRDPARALQFYRKAAAQSNVPAMYKLGVILIKGLLGVSPAPREGINWLKRGADNATPECPHSLHELALCHESSDIPGVIPDETYARQLYIKAGKLGYVPSQVRLGQAYEYGTLGCPVDPRRSIGWYTRAAEKNDGDAELALSGWYLTGAEPHLPQNDVEAFLWARRAADRQLAKAEYAVGYYYECGIGVAHPDVNEAQKWYVRAAQHKNRRAAARLHELKQMGVNVVPPSRAARPRRGKGSLF
ncbi:hypothetical protein IWW54_000542 [Coemansia sp. RSA 2705]|nr:hypothetical protein IWW54_000542 [Coemansia sp. RSA 2705]